MLTVAVGISCSGLDGVRGCHIPSSGLIYACFHVCIMFKFLKPELRKFGSLKTLNKRRAKTLKISFIVPKCSS